MFRHLKRAFEHYFYKRLLSDHMENEGDLQWRNVAKSHWLASSAKARKVRPEVMKEEIWDVLEKEEFGYRHLQELDNLQLLEKSVIAKLR